MITFRTATPPGWNLISSPLELRDSTVTGNFGGDDDIFSDFLIYNQDEEECGIPSCLNTDFNFHVGEGYYLFSENESTLGLQGDLLVDGYTLSLDQGWNLIGNPLVARVIVDFIKVGVSLTEENCDSDSDIFTWIDASDNYPMSEGQCYVLWDTAVSSNAVMPTLHSFNADAKCHMPATILEPFSGYWMHSSVPLNIRVEPHVYDEDFYIDRDDVWSLSLFAAEHNPTSAYENLLWNDMIKIGLGNSFSDGFVYGEDEYDIPFATIPPSFTEIYVDHSALADEAEWEDAGAEQENYFSDFRLLEGPDVSKVWTITGQLLGYVYGDSISLDWTMQNENLIPDHEITIMVGNTMINMKETSNIVIHRDFFENLSITVGPYIDENSCEDQMLVTCPDGSCAPTLEECSCESGGQVECGDGSCAPTLEDCNCESQGLVTCSDGSCINPDEECSCEAEGLVECEDGTCAETEEDCIDLSNMIPDEFSISRPYPNPFNPVVRIDYSLPVMDNISVTIYDINGVAVESIESGLVEAGYHEATWNADRYPSGIYFMQFLSSYESKTMKVMLVK